MGFNSALYDISLIIEFLSVNIAKFKISYHNFRKFQTGLTDWRNRIREKCIRSWTDGKDIELLFS